MYMLLILFVKQFGKGIYFADMSSKSANYCYATLSKKVGLLLLSEVSTIYLTRHISYLYMYLHPTLILSEEKSSFENVEFKCEDGYQ